MLGHPSCTLAILAVYSKAGAEQLSQFGCHPALGQKSRSPTLCGSRQVLCVVLNQLDPFWSTRNDTKPSFSSVTSAVLPKGEQTKALFCPTMCRRRMESKSTGKETASADGDAVFNSREVLDSSLPWAPLQTMPLPNTTWIWQFGAKIFKAGERRIQSKKKGGKEIDLCSLIAKTCGKIGCGLKT